MSKLMLIGILSLTLNSFGQIPASGLVGQWKFSGNANENSGTLNNGTVYGATLTSDRCGNQDSAFYFDGNDYIELSTDAMGITDAISISLWFKSSTTGPDALVSKYTWTGDIGYVTQFDANGAPEIRGRDGNGIFSESNTDGIARNDDKWHHFVGIVDGSVWTAWIDTILVGTDDNGHSSVDIGSCPLPLTFGRLSEYSGSSWRYYTGSLDDIAIYDRAISQSEIIQLFNDNCSTVSLEESSLISSRVYPNPNNGEVHIHLVNNNLYEIENAYLVDILGRKIMLDLDVLRASGTVNLSNNMPSIYHLFFEINGVRHRHKLIVE